MSLGRHHSPQTRAQTQGSIAARPKGEEPRICGLWLPSSLGPHRPIRSRWKTSHRKYPSVKGSREMPSLVVPDFRILFSSPLRNWVQFRQAIDKVYFVDLYMPSCTPTLTALIESRKPGSQPKSFDKPALLLVAQPDILHGEWA